MATKFRIAGLLAVTLILTGVALAQQGHGNDAAGADMAVVAAKSERQERLKLPRPVRTQFAGADADCRADACNMPPKQPEAAIVPAADACSSLGTARDRNGRTIRRLCAFN